MSKLLDELEKMKREDVCKREQTVVDNFNKLMGDFEKPKNKRPGYLKVVTN